MEVERHGRDATAGKRTAHLPLIVVSLGVLIVGLLFAFGAFRSRPRQNGQFRAAVSYLRACQLVGYGAEMRKIRDGYNGPIDLESEVRLCLSSRRLPEHTRECFDVFAGREATGALVLAEEARPVLEALQSGLATPSAGDDWRYYGGGYTIDPRSQMGTVPPPERLLVYGSFLNAETRDLLKSVESYCVAQGRQAARNCVAAASAGAGTSATEGDRTSVAMSSRLKDMETRIDKVIDSVADETVKSVTGQEAPRGDPVYDAGMEMMKDAVNPLRDSDEALKGYEQLMEQWRND